MKRRTLSTAQKVALFIAAQCRCHICNAIIHPAAERWEVEHVIPLAMGGADNETNMRPSHIACHKVKSATGSTDLAKAKRIEARHKGIRKTPTLTNRKWRRKVNGETVLR